MSEEAVVFKAGRRAARLTRTPDGTRFAYDDDYLAAPGPAVASTLPVTPIPRVTAAGAVPPYFAGLLPEGRRLTKLRRAIKASADDELSLLLAVGGDPVGDVQVAAAGAEPDDATVVSVRRSFSEIRFSELLADAGIVDPAGLAGVQEKVSARMISVPIPRRHLRYILKLDPPEYPHVVENEHYFLQRARKAGLRTPEARLVADADGRHGLLVTRFDRIAGEEGVVRRLAVEDGCQALDLWPADKYNVTAEQVSHALIDLCEAKPVAALDVFTQIVFAWLTGNGDLHAKNLSAIQDPDGRWRIAPAYDLPSTAPYGDHTTALPLLGRRDGFSRRHLVEFAAGLGIPERAAVRRLEHLLGATETIDSELAQGAIPFDSHRLAELRRELRARRRQLAA